MRDVGSGSFTRFQSESSNGDLQLCNVLVPVAHFADKQTKAQRGQVLCSVAQLGPGSVRLQVCCGFRSSVATLPSCERTWEGV